MDELFPLIDESGQVTGSASRSECHNGSKRLHPVIHLHIFNKQGELLLQKRSQKKDIQPGKWDTSVGGHVDYGETVEEALMREVREELGIQAFTPEFLRSYIFESDIEKEMVYSYKTVYEGPFVFAPEEIDEIRFWTMKEIERNLGHSVFTPNFEMEVAFFTKEDSVKNNLIDLSIYHLDNIGFN
ncbi:NTP pyrophosphohydrolase [Bacteroidia bacterium]|nr:NTP pyrophosphohydrolase [Bacteroidia bacterium]